MKGEVVAVDSTHVDAYSRRAPDNRTGKSDPEARVGRGKRGFILGYRVHTACCVESEMPLAFTVAPCNENEKKHGPALVARANQRRGEAVLRVDRKFRTHGPEQERVKYHMRPAVEAAYAFLKTQYGMAVNKVRGVRNVAVYALYSVLCHVLTREAAENIGRPDKAVSPTFFNT